MTYSDDNFPAKFVYQSVPAEPCVSFGVPIDHGHPLVRNLHRDLVPRERDGTPWLGKYSSCCLHASCLVASGVVEGVMGKFQRPDTCVDTAT